MRLHEITPEELFMWRMRRAQVGHERYGDSDLDRYALVDVMEELMDVLNILDRAKNRAVQENRSEDFRSLITLLFADIDNDVRRAIEKTIEADYYLPDDFCTDGNARRIWFDEEIAVPSGEDS